MNNIFPQLIRELPPFVGPFEAYQLTAESCRVLFASYPAGTEIPAHHHQTENVGVIIQGKLLLTMDGAVQRFGVGEWYHIPAKKEHAARFELDTTEIEFWFDTGG